MNAKQWLFVIALVSTGLGLVSCDNRRQNQAAQTTASANMPRIAFAEKGIYDFGELTEGDTVEHVFRFTNAGGFPLIINNVTASCGCTTPEWPREPIAPGASSFIRVRFNSQGKMGEQNKTVTIYANTDPAMTDFQFRALVAPKRDSANTNS